MVEEVFGKYVDTAGNLHLHGTETGEHIIRKQDQLSNFQIPDKCKYCGYYYNFRCRAERCIKAELISTYEAIKSACESSYNGVSTISKEVLEDVLFIFDDLKSALDKFMEEVNS